jgi:undecaprenyl-diphosphatase
MMKDLMIFVSFLASWKIIAVLNILAGLYFARQKLWKYLTATTLSSLSDLLIVETLKNIVSEPRPAYAMIVEKSYSFPSGHSYTAVVFYGLLTYLLYKHFRNKYIVLVGVVLISLISYSRIYLGVHYWWDVAVSALLGTAWLAGTIIILNRNHR